MSTLEPKSEESALLAIAASLVAKASYTASEEGAELVSPSVIDEPMTSVLALKLCSTDLNLLEPSQY